MKTKLHLTTITTLMRKAVRMRLAGQGVAIARINPQGIASEVELAELIQRLCRTQPTGQAEAVAVASAGSTLYSWVRHPEFIVLLHAPGSFEDEAIGPSVLTRNSVVQFSPSAVRALRAKVGRCFSEPHTLGKLIELFESYVAAVPADGHRLQLRNILKDAWTTVPQPNPVPMEGFAYLNALLDEDAELLAMAA